MLWIAFVINGSAHFFQGLLRGHIQWLIALANTRYEPYVFDRIACCFLCLHSQCWTMVSHLFLYITSINGASGGLSNVSKASTFMAFYFLSWKMDCSDDHWQRFYVLVHAIVSNIAAYGLDSWLCVLLRHMCANPLCLFCLFCLLFLFLF